MRSTSAARRDGVKFRSTTERAYSPILARSGASLSSVATLAQSASRLPGGDSSPVTSVFHHFGDAPGLQCDHRPPRRHRFRKHQPERLLERGQREDVAGRHQFGHVGAVAGENHVLFDAQIADQGLELREIVFAVRETVVLTDDQKADGRELGSEGGDRPHQLRLALPMKQPRCTQQHGRIHRDAELAPDRCAGRVGRPAFHLDGVEDRVRALGGITTPYQRVGDETGNPDDRLGMAQRPAHRRADPVVILHVHVNHRPRARHHREQPAGHGVPRPIAGVDDANAVPAGCSARD